MDKPELTILSAINGNQREVMNCMLQFTTALDIRHIANIF
jgi:hypothetical protein